MKSLGQLWQQHIRRRVDNGFAKWTRAARLSQKTGSHCFIALQPIFNREKSVFGYEALFRSSCLNRFEEDSQNATGCILAEWMFDGITDLTGSARVFLNCSASDLTGGLLQLLPFPTVLEILETVVPTAKVLAACHQLKALGHQFALDDFQPSPNADAFLEVADFLKIDFRVSAKEQRKAILRRLEGRSFTLVAEKIESVQEYENAIEEGFQLFQGYYLASPTVYAKKRRSVAS